MSWHTRSWLMNWSQATVSDVQSTRRECDSTHLSRGACTFLFEIHKCPPVSVPQSHFVLCTHDHYSIIYVPCCSFVAFKPGEKPFKCVVCAFKIFNVRLTHPWSYVLVFRPNAKKTKMTENRDRSSTSYCRLLLLQKKRRREKQTTKGGDQKPHRLFCRLILFAECVLDFVCACLHRGMQTWLSYPAFCSLTGNCYWSDLKPLSPPLQFHHARPPRCSTFDCC